MLHIYVLVHFLKYLYGEIVDRFTYDGDNKRSYIWASKKVTILLIFHIGTCILFLSFELFSVLDILYVLMGFFIILLIFFPNRNVTKVIMNNFI